jgi:hypothetical protein
MGVTAAVGAVVDTLGVAGTAAAGAAIGAGVAAATGGNALQGALIGGTAGFGGAELAGAAGLTGGAAATTSDMIAQDALSLQAQGLPAEQISQTLAQSYNLDPYAAQNIAGMAAGGSSAAQISSTLASDYGANLTGVTQGATSLSGLLGTAKTGAQIIGGLGQIAGGVNTALTGQKVGQLAQRADPFSQYRPALASQLNQLLQDPNTVTTTPGYQFNLSQGLQGLQAQQAAQGRLVSGGALLQGQQYGQQLASQTYQQQLANLASLSGATQSPSTGTTAQANLLSGQVGGGLGGAQAIAQGLGVLTGQSPLDTLYMNYNKSSPAVS